MDIDIKQKDYSFNDILLAVNSALNELYANHQDDIDEMVNEDTITSKLAGYLKPHFKELKVDTFYNRYHRPYRRESGTKRATMPNGEEKIIKPDIIVHGGKWVINNILCTECKGYWNQDKERRNKDIDTLAALTRSIPSGALRDPKKHWFAYKYGLFIEYGRTRSEVIIKRIVNGSTNLVDI